ncbi:hypothetical protein GCM10008949_33820 [Deinococcus humi]|nr:hypothetical protein GCM10008949_33820 [Deinococcus humi]
MVLSSGAGWTGRAPDWGPGLRHMTDLCCKFIIRPRREAAAHNAREYSSTGRSGADGTDVRDIAFAWVTSPLAGTLGHDIHPRRNPQT